MSILCTCCSQFLWYCFISFTIVCAPVFFLIHRFFSLSNFVIPSKCLKNFICAASKRTSLLVYQNRETHERSKKGGSHLKILGARRFTKQVPYWETTNIGLHRTELSRPVLVHACCMSMSTKTLASPLRKSHISWLASPNQFSVHLKQSKVCGVHCALKISKLPILFNKNTLFFFKMLLFLIHDCFFIRVYTIF